MTGDSQGQIRHVPAVSRHDLAGRDYASTVSDLAPPAGDPTWSDFILIFVAFEVAFYPSSATFGWSFHLVPGPVTRRPGTG
jgi:hypothetical protein